MVVTYLEMSERPTDPGFPHAPVGYFEGIDLSAGWNGAARIPCRYGSFYG